MTTPSLVGTQAPRRRPLPMPAACAAAPRAGAPLLARAGQTHLALSQRDPRDAALSLAAVGFPGLSLDAERERGSLTNPTTETELSRLGLAYLRGERASAALPHEQATALAETLRQLQRPHCVRAELTGPVSLALQLVDSDERPLAYDPALREALVQHLVLRAAWLRDQLALAASGVVICFDEPFLDALGVPLSPLSWREGADMLARVLSEIPGPCGLCVAGNPPWAELVALPADVIFFDAYEHSADLIQAAPFVVEHLNRGGSLGWGLIPNDPADLAQERAETLAHRFISSVAYLADASGLTPVQLSRAALISTNGRLGHLEAEEASHAAGLCANVAALLQAHYQLAT
ncbi:MAG: hypothetical protein AB4911_11205 [Oscillochloridaceae bacterium umkhey_bin13]